MIFAAAFLVSGCVQDVLVPDDTEQMQSIHHTKVANTSEDALQGSLLLLLCEEFAAMTEEGRSDDAFDAVCNELAVSAMERVFPSADDMLSRTHRLHRWYMVTFPENRSLDLAVRRFAALESVEVVQYNTVIYRPDYGPVHGWEPLTKGYGEMNLPFNDPMLSDQWHFINNQDLSICPTVRDAADIGVRDVWNHVGGNPDIIVAVCDEGVKYSHPDLASNMWVNTGEIAGNGRDDDGNGYIDDVYGYNFLNPVDARGLGLLPLSWDRSGDTGHGTHAAGVIAAVNNNGTGVSGVAGGTGNGDGVRIMSCQIYSGNRMASADGRARAYKYAADNGASILQCPYGVTSGFYTSDGQYEGIHTIEKDALAYFINKPNCMAASGNIVIYPSGDDASPLSAYPAAYHDYISVSALGPDYLPAAYTNYGPGCNISAPGGDISIGQIPTAYRAQVLSTVPEEIAGFSADYGYMQGTSVACSHVTGVVALGLSYALQKDRSFTRDEYIAMVYSSVNDLDALIQTSTKQAYGVDFDIMPMKGGMGTGAIDAWRLIMQVEGIPSLTVKKGEWCRLSLHEYFGGSANGLTYTSVDIDEVSREMLGIEEDPYIKNGRLHIRCNKTGSMKIRISAVAGGTEEGGDSMTGGTVFTRTISVLSRNLIASNGGWL